MSEQRAVHERCWCLQWGRCLVGCPKGEVGASVGRSHRGGTEGGHTVSDECTHPSDGVMWNEWNGVIQCHRCGAVTLSATDASLVATLDDLIGEFGARGVDRVLTTMRFLALPVEPAPSPVCPECGSTDPAVCYGPIVGTHPHGSTRYCCDHEFHGRAE
jgi:hypothetical protein